MVVLHGVAVLVQPHKRSSRQHPCDDAHMTLS
jgi:hypothetical protein